MAFSVVAVLRLGGALEVGVVDGELKDQLVEVNKHVAYVHFGLCHIMRKMLNLVEVVSCEIN